MAFCCFFFRFVAFLTLLKIYGNNTDEKDINIF